MCIYSNCIIISGYDNKRKWADMLLTDNDFQPIALHIGRRLKAERKIKGMVTECCVMHWLTSTRKWISNICGNLQKIQ